MKNFFTRKNGFIILMILSTFTLAGSGKTLLACQIALEKLFMKEVEKIIITRPLPESQH